MPLPVGLGANVVIASWEEGHATCRTTWDAALGDHNDLSQALIRPWLEAARREMLEYPATPPREPTEAELALIREREEEMERARGRAEKLLADVLSESQLQALRSESGLRIKSRLHPGRVYAIVSGRIRVFEEGNEVGGACLVFKNDATVGHSWAHADLLLAKVLTVCFREEELEKLANWSWFDPVRDAAAHPDRPEAPVERPPPPGSELFRIEADGDQWRCRGCGEAIADIGEVSHHVEQHQRRFRLPVTTTTVGVNMGAERRRTVAAAARGDLPLDAPLRPNPAPQQV